MIEILLLLGAVPVGIFSLLLGLDRLEEGLPPRRAPTRVRRGGTS